MEPEVQNTEVKEKHPLFKVTPLSKYLVMILFILMPFVGGYVGYVYAPEKVVEVEKKVEQGTEKMEIDEVLLEKSSILEVGIFNDDSNGALYLSNGRLQFVDSTGLVTDLKKNFVFNNTVSVPSVYRNKIYYSLGDTFRAFDPFKGEEKTYEIPNVISMQAVKDDLYVTTGTFVGATTTISLYKISLVDDQVEFLGEIPEPYFVTYMESLNSLYLVDGIEGQGCFNVKFSQFDLTLRKVVAAEAFKACVDDINFKEEKARYVAFESNLDNDYAKGGSFMALVKEGRIIEPTQSDENEWSQRVDGHSGWEFFSATD